MFKKRTEDDRFNICGINIAALRKKRKMSQRQLAEQLQLIGVDLHKNTVQKMESGERTITDLELKGFADYFEVSVDDLYAGS